MAAERRRRGRLRNSELSPSRYMVGSLGLDPRRACPLEYEGYRTAGCIRRVRFFHDADTVLGPTTAVLARWLRRRDPEDLVAPHQVGGQGDGRGSRSPPPGRHHPSSLARPSSSGHGQVQGDETDGIGATVVVGTPLVDKGLVAEIRIPLASWSGRTRLSLTISVLFRNDAALTWMVRTAATLRLATKRVTSGTRSTPVWTPVSVAVRWWGSCPSVRSDQLQLAMPFAVVSCTWVDRPTPAVTTWSRR